MYPVTLQTCTRHVGFSNANTVPINLIPVYYNSWIEWFCCEIKVLHFLAFHDLHLRLVEQYSDYSLANPTSQTSVESPTLTNLNLLFLVISIPTCQVFQIRCITVVVALRRQYTLACSGMCVLVVVWLYRFWPCYKFLKEWWIILSLNTFKHSG